MPNPWGANTGSYQPFYTNLIGSANVSCPAGVETNVVSVANVNSINPGNFTPAFVGYLGVSLGATPPTALQVAIRMNNGADLGLQTVPPGMLVANASLMIPLWLWNVPSSGTQWIPPGQTLQLSLNPTAQAVTALQAASGVYYWLMRVGE